MTIRWLPLVLMLASTSWIARGHGQHHPEEQHREEGNAWRSSRDVPPLLLKAIQEQRVGHYVGRRTVEFQGPQHLEHEEIVYRDGSRTRIEFPSGSRFSGQIIVEAGQERRHYMPDRNVILLLPPRREESYDRLVGIAKRAAAKRITLACQRGEKIAGIPTDEIVARDAEGLVFQRLFIDPHSGVVLKRQVFDASGSQIGYFKFTQINLAPGAFESSLFRLDRKGARIVTPMDTLREITANQGFEPLVLAPSSGYRLEESRIQTLQNQKILVETFGSRNGRVTLFELRGSVSPDRLQKFAHGDFQVFTVQRGDKTVVLLGPRTQEELGLIAQSIGSGTP